MKAYDATTITALGQPNARLVIFLEMVLDGPVYVRYVTAGFDLVWNSVTWSGMGAIMSIDPIRETGSVESVGLKVTFSGVPSDLLSLALQTNVMGRTATMWVGVYSEAGALVATPVKEFEGRIDNLEISDMADNSQVVLSIESRLVTLLRAENLLYTDAEQRRRNATDGSMRFINTVVERTLAFGPKR